ncbi:stage II sporulation protein D [Paenibacillus radicis (ex Xue et al. 2023)]|uniref:Stage II sporulation protein D n=1 Tax=Paenibacillus radicis (ex Xue et al. 2023) TaxID=2972489 RepID=A0ABT1YIT7_9BACL|nr:stage II sporulation protein D [Paenibacillus radicis (ex Xue et al. 2023)]MCR8632339.1 stage II sporulation protein D [Paenibacillus radicis (ex Xue et al. 2023)]
MDKKKAIRWAAICLSSFVAVVVIVPSILVKSNTRDPSSAGVLPPPSLQQSQLAEQPAFQIPVYMSKQKKVEMLLLEQYVRGVLAAEMPIEFELEAMKAQAIAARTYIIRRMIEQDSSNVPVVGAWVTDTVAHQAYVTNEDLKKRWGPEAYKANSDKLDHAVNETKDLILTYKDKPIQANFFSTSNGFTENSEDYWNEYIPYLRSVPSPWDIKLSPRYKETITVPFKDLQRKLGTTGVLPVSTNSSNGLKVLEMTQGHRIKKMVVGGKTFTGREVRERLGLNSSQFQWSWKGSDLQITTFGYGHGVGMSQWGANGMAKEGKTAEQIVKYYYTGIEIDRASNLVKK